MPTCEDAPCCGCCGPAVWAADAASEADAAWDRLNDPDAWWSDEDDEDASDAEPDAREDFGWFGDEALCGE